MFNKSHTNKWLNRNSDFMSMNSHLPSSTIIKKDSIESQPPMSDNARSKLGIQFAQKVLQNFQNKPLVVHSDEVHRNLVSRSKERFKLLGFKSKQKHEFQTLPQDLAFIAKSPEQYNNIKIVSQNNSPSGQGTTTEKVNDYMKRLQMRNKTKQKIEYERYLELKKHDSSMMSFSHNKDLQTSYISREFQSKIELDQKLKQNL